MPKGSPVSRSLFTTLLLIGLITSTASPQSIADIVSRAKPAVVFVFSRLPSGGLSMGSGFVVDPNGFILTAHHILDRGGTPSVTVPGSPGIAASRAASDRGSDIAILRVNRTALPTITLGDSNTLRQGEDILVMGYPRADALGASDSTVTRGIVGSLRSDLIQIDAPINPGNSGGPVLNLRGEAVGIVVAGLRGTTGINFAVAINSVKPVIATALSSAGALPPPTTFAPVLPPSTTSPRPSTTPRGDECRPASTDDRSITSGNDVSNCVVERFGPARIRLTVAYTYSMVHGSQSILLGADILAAGSRLRWFGYRPAPITGSSGTVSIDVVYGVGNPPAGRLATDQIEFFMYVAGGQIFHRKIFNLVIDWQF